VLIPNDTYRKHITDITAVLLPFVTHLLTLPRIRDLYSNPGRGTGYFSYEFSWFLIRHNVKVHLISE
jgi:hypothetical protein